jgi:hypothetical protein
MSSGGLLHLRTVMLGCGCCARSRPGIAAGRVQQAAPGSANDRESRVIDIAGRVVLGSGHERIGQLHWDHIVPFGRFHNVDAGLIEAAMAQSDKNTLSRAETSLTAVARLPLVIGLSPWIHRMLFRCAVVFMLFSSAAAQAGP